MSEQGLEAYTYQSFIFKTPYCQCDLYENKGNQYRVFQIKEDVLMDGLIQEIQETTIDYSLYNGKLYLIMPYVETTSLEDWLKKRQSLQDIIQMCEEILFLFLSKQLPNSYCLICIDTYSIGIDKNNQPHLMINPAFSRLKYQTSSLNIYSDCAKMINTILMSSKDVYKCKKKNPPLYEAFLEKMRKKEYQSFDEILQSLLLLEKSFEKKPRQWNKLIRICTALLITFTILVLGAILFVYYTNWVNSTYDGLDSIGGSRLSEETQTIMEEE